MLTPTIGPTRTKVDFAQHFARAVDTDPDATWIFVLDQLNTHKSETGVLKPMATRNAFLEDATHRIRFVGVDMLATEKAVG